MKGAPQGAGKDGADGQDGADGAQGPVGPKDLKDLLEMMVQMVTDGAQGPMGPMGPQGPAGNDDADGQDLKPHGPYQVNSNPGLCKRWFNRDWNLLEQTVNNILELMTFEMVRRCPRYIWK